MLRITRFLLRHISKSLDSMVLFFVMEIRQADFVKGIRGTDPITDSDMPQIAFFGRSNVGKSSTINMLLNRKSLVKSSGTPGKTREINFFKVNDQFLFVDLPGYGYAKVSKSEREKLRKLILWYLRETNPAERILIVVLDAQVGITDYDREILETAIRRDESVVVVMNKMDKLNQKNKKIMIDKVMSETNYPVVAISAKKGRGRDEFFKTVFNEE